MNTNSYTISAEQRFEIETLITNGDRVGFYIALHNMTGSEAALDMAEIASSSGLRGGTAWALNSAYADVLDGYPAGGVTAFSIEIAERALQSIEARPDGTYEVPSDIRTYENAKAAWNAVGGRRGVPDLGDKYFPGNIMIAQHHMLRGNASDAWRAAGMESYIATGAGAGLLFWEALTEIAADGYNHTASLNDFLQQNTGTTVETFTSEHDAHLTVIKDAAGKTIGVIRGDGPLGIAGQFVEGMSSLLRPYADALNALGRWIGQTLPIPHAVDLAVNTQYKSSRLNSSPLILDLDGDGIEVTPLSGAITFDHDADGVRTGTAWAGADDGLLVLDLDGNGLIDSGRELFGNNTVLANGQKAADGYAALRALDANADG